MKQKMGKTKATQPRKRNLLKMLSDDADLVVVSRSYIMRVINSYEMSEEEILNRLHIFFREPLGKDKRVIQ